MSPTDRTFPAKVLLFGEYTILLNGWALTLPLHRFSGQWTFHAPTAPDPFLAQYCQWLSSQPSPLALRLDAMQSDIQRGLSFSSSIPMGKGLGSSGALVAAVAHRYSHSLPLHNPDQLQQELAHLEHFPRHPTQHTHLLPPRQPTPPIDRPTRPNISEKTPTSQLPTRPPYPLHAHRPTRHPRLAPPTLGRALAIRPPHQPLPMESLPRNDPSLNPTPLGRRPPEKILLFEIVRRRGRGLFPNLHPQTPTNTRHSPKVPYIHALKFFCAMVQHSPFHVHLPCTTNVF